MAKISFKYMRYKKTHDLRQNLRFFDKTESMAEKASD